VPISTLLEDSEKIFWVPTTKILEEMEAVSSLPTSTLLEESDFFLGATLEYSGGQGRNFLRNNHDYS
jgi:hypothetical protein